MQPGPPPSDRQTLKTQQPLHTNPDNPKATLDNPSQPNSIPSQNPLALEGIECTEKR